MACGKVIRVSFDEVSYMIASVIEWKIQILKCMKIETY
jgi:hypothetical protein